jgi:NTE family protein
MEKTNFSVLCANGGGVRGALQVGALRSLGVQDLHTLFPEGVYGISIGAVLCALIAFRFTLAEIEDCSRELLKADAFLDPPRLHTVMELEARMGVDTGTRLVEVWTKMFARKGYDLATLKVGDAAIPLYIVASDLTRSKAIIFNEGVRVVDALRASTAIPVVFTPHVLRGRVFVDGAVLCSNIVRFVPRSQRESMLALLLVHPDSPMQTLSQLVGRIVQCRSKTGSRWAADMYPQNVCVLTEPSEGASGALDLNPPIEDMFAQGEALCRDFLAKRRP